MYSCHWNLEHYESTEECAEAMRDSQLTNERCNGYLANNLMEIVCKLYADFAIEDEKLISIALIHAGVVVTEDNRERAKKAIAGLIRNNYLRRPRRGSVELDY